MIENHLAIGETATFSKTITEADIVLFSGLTGDFDPIHKGTNQIQRSIIARELLTKGLPG
jgi:3-hydroxybutyryl-CoA dehydratase